jgi:diaminohydroxyphosphoribosylaminopyrimidine deaminase/5-amino-6-(5-phosphoribosylamino)uracil reductase
MPLAGDGLEPDDYRLMGRALQLAERGYYSARPNPRVGCVIAHQGQIVGEGFHYRAGEPHAEINALQSAQERARGATVYVTLEPCCHHGRTPPCADALIAARVARVVYACADPNPRVDGGGAQRLRKAGITVASGIMSAPAAEQNRGFFRRMRLGRPFVTIKLGMTLDGKTALASGASRWITGIAARADVQRLRAASGAIITGVGTVNADDPALNVRDDRFDLAGQQPLRVILDSNLRCAPASKMLRLPGETLVYFGSDNQSAAQVLRDAGARTERVGMRSTGLDLNHILTRLGEHEVNDVLLEAGATLCGAFIRERLFDEIVIYIAPKLFGNAARDGFNLTSPPHVADAPELELIDVRQIGSDLRLTLRPPDVAST